MLDRALVERIASDLRSDASLVEKDWHVVRALGVIAQLDHAEMALAFSGGTSLSKGYDAIRRFSEANPAFVARASVSSSCSNSPQVGPRRNRFSRSILTSRLTASLRRSGTPPRCSRASIPGS